MKYHVFDNGTAIITTRSPEAVVGNLQISFIGAPPGAMAVFEVGGNVMYRDLQGSYCLIPVDKLLGEIKVSLTVLDGSARPKKWKCENLFCKKTAGFTLIYPDEDLSKKCTELTSKTQDLHEKNRILDARVRELEKKLESLCEGYDFT